MLSKDICLKSVVRGLSRKRRAVGRGQNAYHVIMRDTLSKWSGGLWWKNIVFVLIDNKRN